MSIELIRLGSGSLMIAIEGADSWAGFKQLVQNGSYLYPDLPAEIKTFADEVTVGKALQNYVDDKPKPIVDAVITKSDIEEAFCKHESVVLIPMDIYGNTLHCRNCKTNISVTPVAHHPI